MRPKLLGHERHERMQQLDDFVEDKGGRGAGLVLGRPVRALQERLGEFEIPVAKNIPDETIGGVGGVVETIGFDRRGDFGNGLGGLADDPAVERDLDSSRIERGLPHAAVHLGETRRVPEFRSEIAIAFDALRRELDVASLRRHGGEREAQRIGAIGRR